MYVVSHIMRFVCNIFIREDKDIDFYVICLVYLLHIYRDRTIKDN